MVLKVYDTIEYRRINDNVLNSYYEDVTSPFVQKVVFSIRVNINLTFCRIDEKPESIPVKQAYH